MKFKDYFGEKQCDNIRKQIEEAFECDEAVFIIIGTIKGDKRDLTDSYMGVCDKCVLQAVEYSVKDAKKKGLLVDEKLSCFGRFNWN